MNRFDGKVALVTGAAQGIGRAVCAQFKTEGARVVAVDRSPLVHEMAGESMLTLTADLERHEDCSRVMDAAVEKFGKLDILVNNVGGTIWPSLSSITILSRSRLRFVDHCSPHYGAVMRRCHTCSSRAAVRS